MYKIIIIPRYNCFSEDISKVEIEFDKLDYENYDYAEKGKIVIL